MNLVAAVAAVMIALPASASGLWRSHVLPGQVRCSDLPAVSATPVSATTSDNVQTKIGEACGAGAGILELAAGTYTDVNVQLGTGGQAIGGECVIRAATSKPTIRATVGTNRAIFQVRNVTHRIRFENLILDGRRGSQTNAAIDACPDSPPDGICDTGTQNSTDAMGIDSRITGGGPAQTCVLDVDVIDTVGDAFFLRNQSGSTVENSTADGMGCDSTTCPSVTVPNDIAVESVKTNGRGVNFVDSDDTMAVDVTITDATKQGIQCYGSTDCYGLDSSVTNVGSTGLTMLGSSGVMLGNAVSTIGTGWTQNSTTVANGEGALVTDGGLGLDFDAAIRRTTITNTWGDGIRVGLQAGTPPQPIVRVENNTVTNPCITSTATTNAGLSLGDNIDPFERLIDTANTVSANGCTAAKRVRNLPDYEATGTVISGSDVGVDGVVYEASVIAETSLTTDRDVEIDAGSSGTLSGCTLNGGAVVNDLSAGAVTRSGGC